MCGSLQEALRLIAVQLPQSNTPGERWPLICFVIGRAQFVEIMAWPMNSTKARLQERDYAWLAVSFPAPSSSLQA